MEPQSRTGRESPGRLPGRSGQRPGRRRRWPDGLARTAVVVLAALGAAPIALAAPVAASVAAQDSAPVEPFDDLVRRLIDHVQQRAILEPAEGLELLDQIEGALARGAELDGGLALDCYAYAYATLGPSVPTTRTTWTEQLSAARRRYLNESEESLYAVYLENLLMDRLRAEFALEEAVALCDEIIERLGARDPRSLRLACDASGFLRAGGDVDGAIDRIAALLALEPGLEIQCRAVTERAQCWIDVGLPDLACRVAEAAVELGEAALAESEARGEPSDDALGIALIRAAEAYLIVQRYDESIAAVDRVESLANSSKTVREIAARIRGNAYFERFKRAEASGEGGAVEDLERARAALEAATGAEVESPATAALAAMTLADIALAMGDLALSREHLKRARDVVDRRFSADAGSGIRGKIAGLIEIVGAEHALDSGDDAELRAAHGAVSAAYASLLEGWAAAPLRSGGVGFLHERSRRAVLTTLFKLERAVYGADVGAERSFAALLRAQSLSTLAQKRSAQEATLEGLVGLLAEGEGVVAFVPEVESAWIFAVDREGVWAEELGPGERLRREVELVNLSLRREPRGLTGEVESALRPVSDLRASLFPSAIEERLASWSAVSFLGCELLGDVPVEALIGVGSTPDLAVSRWPSAALAGDLRESAPSSSRAPLALISAPSTSERQAARWPTLDPLPPAGSEPGELARRLGLPLGSARSGDAADLDALRAAGLGVEVTAVLAHGLFDPGRERPAGLLLADRDDDPLAGAAYCEALDQFPASPIVLLLTCGAARGPRRFGDDGATNLAGAFLAGGAWATVLAASEVSYQASLLFGEAVVRALAEGASVSEASAIGRARVRADDRFAHPFHWSAFRVVGDGSYRPFLGRTDLADALGPAPSGARRPPLSIVGSALLLLAAAGALALSRRRAA